MMRKTLLFGLLLLLLPTSCSFFPMKTKTGVIAQVDKNQLLVSDIISLIPSGLPREDSLAMLRQYINAWALAHLMEARAQKELPKEQRDVSQSWEEYRRSLLVYRYEKSYVETRIDTTITQEELLTAYQNNSELFTLSEPIVKARYIKIALSSPYLQRVRSLYRTHVVEEIYDLEQMLQNTAEKYDVYNNQWISASSLSKELPISTDEVIRSVSQGYLECTDNFYAYYVAILEVTRAGTVAPMEYEEVSIRNIILGKRKQDLLKNLEKEVLEQGWKSKQLKVYYNENE